MLALSRKLLRLAHGGHSWPDGNGNQMAGSAPRLQAAGAGRSGGAFWVLASRMGGVRLTRSARLAPNCKLLVSYFT